MSRGYSRRGFLGRVAFAAPGPKVEQALLELGARGGIMDAKEALEFGPKVLLLPEDYVRLNKPIDTTISTPLFDLPLAAQGVRLGPVGGRIVAEVMIGALKLDKESYLAMQPRWKPTFAREGRFRMVDFLSFAGVDPQSRAA